MKFHQVVDGEWVQPRRRNYYMKCCGCGLTHRLNFRLVPSHNKKGWTIQFQAFRCQQRKRR